MQSYIVYRDGDETVARGRIDGRILMRDGSASGVLQEVMTILEQQGGGQAFIECGQYVIDRPIRLPSMISVCGSGRGTVLKLHEANREGAILIAETREAILLADFTCQGVAGHSNSSGIVLDECGDCEIRSVYARDFSDYGFWIRHNSFMTKLSNSTTSENGKAGIYMEELYGDEFRGPGAGRGGDYLPNLVMGCTSLGEKGHSFELKRTVCAHIVGCLAFQPKGHGFYLHHTSNSAVLTGNRCFQGFRNGIMVENTHELNVTGNIMCWNHGHGIELNHVTWGTISGNEFIDNGGKTEPQRRGVYLHGDTKSIQVTGNTVFNWEHFQPMMCGIYESDTCRNNQITHNNINHFTDSAVFSAGENTNIADNIGVPERYPVPGLEPFRTEFKYSPSVVHPPVTRERLERFLSLTRR